MNNLKRASSRIRQFGPSVRAKNKLLAYLQLLLCMLKRDLENFDELTTFARGDQLLPLFAYDISQSNASDNQNEQNNQSKSSMRERLLTDNLMNIN